MTTPTLPTRDAEIRTITEKLAEPFDPKDVKFKPQMVKNNRCLAMAYIDARLIQDRLDDVLGAENWQDEYEILVDGSVMCRLKIKLGSDWITKADVGSPSEQPDIGDRLKAAFSDALKRAAVKFGIGRYLYRLPATWVDYDAVKKQIVRPPQLPAFALPPQGDPGCAQSAHTTPVDEKPTEPKMKPVPNLPTSGPELHRRLREYDAKLAEKKLCALGALLAHVTQAGIRAGYSANLAEWTGPAIQFAVDTVREFDQSVRNAKPEPRNAA